MSKAKSIHGFPRELCHEFFYNGNKIGRFDMHRGIGLMGHYLGTRDTYNKAEEYIRSLDEGGNFSIVKVDSKDENS